MEPKIALCLSIFVLRRGTWGLKDMHSCFHFGIEDPITGSRQNLYLFDYSENNMVAVNLTSVLQ